MHACFECKDSCSRLHGKCYSISHSALCVPVNRIDLIIVLCKLKLNMFIGAKAWKQY